MCWGFLLGNGVCIMLVRLSNTLAVRACDVVQVAVYGRGRSTKSLVFLRGRPELDVYDEFVVRVCLVDDVTHDFSFGAYDGAVVVFNQVCDQTNFGLSVTSRQKPDVNEVSS